MLEEGFHERVGPIRGECASDRRALEHNAHGTKRVATALHLAAAGFLTFAAVKSKRTAVESMNGFEKRLSIIKVLMA